MYKRILVPMEHSRYDELILSHVKSLAHMCDSTVVLIHVADGWAARNLRALTLRESEEIRLDREYIEEQCALLRSAGIAAESVLAAGDPASEIASAAVREKCDLIAMAVHGHRLFRDILHGSTANGVRHQSMVPVLMVRTSLGKHAVEHD